MQPEDIGRAPAPLSLTGHPPVVLWRSAMRVPSPPSSPQSPAVEADSGRLTSLSHPGWAAADVVTRVRNRITEQGSDAGMTTAEYAVGTVAACGFSGVLYKVITNDAVLDMLGKTILRAFKLVF